MTFTQYGCQPQTTAATPIRNSQAAMGPDTTRCPSMYLEGVQSHRKNWLTNVKQWNGLPVQDLLTITQNAPESADVFTHVLSLKVRYQSRDERKNE